MNLTQQIEIACGRIAPLWPLKFFVAVNPYFGLRDQPFWHAHNTLERIIGTGLCLPRSYYQEQIESGRISRSDLAAALQELGSPWDVAAFERVMAAGGATTRRAPFALITDVLGGLDHKDWSSFVIDRISQYCAAYFDEGQALWRMPWRDKSLYHAWQAFTRIDKSGWMMGLRGMGDAVAALPDSPQDAIAWALQELEVPTAAVEDYLHAALLSVGGWAGWARYQRWQAELTGARDDSLLDLLAIRLAWDVLLYKLRFSEALKDGWLRSLVGITSPAPLLAVGSTVEAVLQTALEIGYQRQLVGALSGANGVAQRPGRPAVQAVFCIDVRSEVFRRALETVAPSVQTLGFAGFFGVLMEYVPFGSAEAKGHFPILFNASYRICERPDGADGEKDGDLIAQRHRRMYASKVWKSFKTSASSCFSFVEAVGLVSAPKLLSDSMGWSRPVSHPDSKGLNADVHGRLRPGLTPSIPGLGGCAGAKPTGIPAAERPAVAEFALRNMGLIKNFSRLVLLVGHGSTTVNNPQATGLDCGACAGQTGEASARITVALLNDPVTRNGLAEIGIVIPNDTFFIAGLHDTTSDEMELFDTNVLPESHAKDLAELRDWLDSAGEMTRMERAVVLGTSALPPAAIDADIHRRTHDWAQVRPEWGLAGNAAFIAAPRNRTSGCNLDGRAFLHDYNWHDDVDFGTLTQIMTAPMVVGNWINMQYYGSVVDNRHFGSGNKVLHNVVGGSIGVLEGNGGDLRVGLPLQSLHDGKRWVHEPMRLNVVIEAPQDAIDNVIRAHELVRELVENSWLHLFQIEEDGKISRRDLDKQWQPIVV